MDLVERAAIDYWCGLTPSQQKRQFYLELKRHCLDRGYRPGWTGCMYRERFGTWPPDGAERLPPAADVSVIVRDWLVERNKRFFAEKNARERARAGRA
ncbi:MAG TPA: hypothetical protein VGG62_11565 [Terracidiphilus sp.]|jgi:hypothetical protein